MRVEAQHDIPINSREPEVLLRIHNDLRLLILMHEIQNHNIRHVSGRRSHCFVEGSSAPARASFS
jgi:hypothetical protein